MQTTVILGSALDDGTQSLDDKISYCTYGGLLLALGDGTAKISITHLTFRNLYLPRNSLRYLPVPHLLLKFNRFVRALTTSIVGLDVSKLRSITAIGP